MSESTSPLSQLQSRPNDQIGNAKDFVAQQSVVVPLDPQSVVSTARKTDGTQVAIAPLSSQSISSQITSGDGTNRQLVEKLIVTTVKKPINFDTGK